MKYDQVLIRYGELMLKGRNRNDFMDAVYRLIYRNVKDLDVQIIKTHDRLYLEINDVSEEIIIERLKRVSGISSFSFVKKVENNIETIKEMALELANKKLKNGASFKIETKRANKRFPMISPDITKEVASYILPKINKPFTIDVRNPNQILHIEIRHDKTNIYIDTIKGLGGFPSGIQGYGLSLLSGGIDSPIATFLAMKQGIYPFLLHFDSSPLTPIESVQKVIDLTKKIALYSPYHEVTLKIVPFFEIHQQILKEIPDPYIITVMRRIMFRIAEKIAESRGIKALITGESIGQVASQTLESMYTIEKVINMPVLRPLLTYDKQDIVNLAIEYGFYDISIRPFEDCCAIYLPKHPATKPTVDRAERYEKKLDIDRLVDEAVERTMRWIILANTDLDISLHGFTSEEAWSNLHED